MLHAYREELAERSLEISPSSDGEFWTFFWYPNPITQGLSEFLRIDAHVTFEGEVNIITFIDNETMNIDVNDYVRLRYERFGVEND